MFKTDFQKNLHEIRCVEHGPRMYYLVRTVQ